MREGYGYRLGNGQKLVTDTKRVMLIDDNRDIGLSFRIVLEHYYESSLKVDIFTDPLTALDNFESNFIQIPVANEPLVRKVGEALSYFR